MFRNPDTRTMSTTDLFTRIAQTHLHIETLETRHRDSLDFHDVGVWCVRDALRAAYEAGVAEGLRQAGRTKQEGATRRKRKE